MKRFIDLQIVLLSSVLVVPLFLIISILVRVYIGRPVLFVQMRPGLNGKPFNMIKFRTMTDDRDSRGYLLPDSKRLTSFGRFLRASSLDELPELWNVLKGEMSLVGPRPLLMQYLERYNTEQARRHEVKPGITGWAQVNGRNSISWNEKFDLDVWYVENRTNILDIKILYMTIVSVLSRTGITDAEGHSMSGFMGNSKEVDGGSDENKCC